MQLTTETSKEPPSNTGTLTSPLHQAVELNYDDGKWYRGTITSFNIMRGKWNVHFEVMFPGKEVRFV